MSLVIELPKKSIAVNGKQINVPKLNLKHYNIIKDIRSPEESLKLLMDSIYKGLSVAEKDYVGVHLLEYNKKLKSEVTKDGYLYKISDVYICQKLKFELGDKTYKFRSATLELSKGPIDIMLKNCCVSVIDKDGNKHEVPDFLDMPAFVVEWMEDIVQTVAIKGPTGEIKGLNKILEIFS